MALGLTPRQEQTLDFIRQSIVERGYPPTLKEIGEFLGLRSTNAVNDHLRALERKGFLRRDDMKSSALRMVEGPAEDRVPARDVCFLSYSRKDRPYLDRLLVHMRPLIRDEVIKAWNDRDIAVGDKWRAEIGRALARAKVAVLLVSADFLASDFIAKNELPPLLEAAEKEGARIIPVIIKPCLFTRDERLSGFQAVNDPANPLLAMSEYEQELVYVKLVELLDLYLRGADE